MRNARLLSAITLLAASSAGAYAADLPVAPEPVDYVRVCDAFGTGFFYIPGTETCLRVEGRVRAEYRFDNFGDSDNSWDDREDFGTYTRARGTIRLDARTNTEYGLVRAYINTYFENNSNNGTGTGTTLEHAFIQFGNFTFGRTASLYDFWTGYSYGNFQTQYTDVRTWVAAYTASLGNGLTATVSIEDATFRNDLTSVAGGDRAGHRLPDLVANLRADQAWGSAQIMGALHEVRFTETASDTKLGYAIGAGVQINVPYLAEGDAFALQAMYGDGASAYVLDSWDSDTITDATLDGTSVKTTKAWGVGAGFLHNFNEQWDSSLEGGYYVADAAGSTNDFKQWGANFNVNWKPVSDLTIGTEFAYRNFDFNSASSSADRDEFYTTIRVERTF
jgi:hypothetical protein